VFQGNHNNAGIVFQLPPWTGSFTSPMEHLERSLAEHWDRSSRPFVDSFAFNWARQSIAPGVVTLLAAVVLAAIAGFGGALFALFGGGIWFLVLYLRSQTAAANQRKAQELVDRGKHDSITQLRAAGAELTDWSSAFRAADSQEPAVRAVIADLATMGQAASVYERRVADRSST
jgi:hypothetical protein